MFNKEFENSLLDNILVKLPEYRDVRGALSFVQKGNENFEFERVFWLYDVPCGCERGGHAHKTCAELLFAVHGSFDLELFDGHKKMVVHLDKPSEGVIIRPMVWCRLYNFSNDFVGLCLASQDYRPEGYINTLEQFEQIVEG